MTREEMIAAIQQPAFEASLRARAKELIETMTSKQVAVPEMRFEHEGIPVRMVPPGANGLIELGGEGEEALYRFRMPLAWLSNTITPPEGS